MSSIKICDRYPSPFKVDIVQLWRKDISDLYKRWIRIFSDHVFIEIVRKGIIESHNIEEFDSWDFFSVAYKYYVESLCFSIRHTIDKSDDVISLINILTSMYINNEFLTFERGTELFNDTENMEEKELLTAEYCSEPQKARHFQAAFKLVFCSSNSTGLW